MAGGGGWWRPVGRFYRVVAGGGEWWRVVAGGGGGWSLLLGAFTPKMLRKWVGAHFDAYLR